MIHPKTIGQSASPAISRVRTSIEAQVRERLLATGVICKKCRFKGVGLDRHWCGFKTVVGYDYVKGKPAYDTEPVSCGRRNRNGDCSLFQPKVPLWKRILHIR